MTRERAFEIFCKEAKITDPVIRELRVKPIFMRVWEICKKNTLEEACEWLRVHMYKDKPDIVFRTNVWENVDHLIRDFEEEMENRL